MRKTLKPGEIADRSGQYKVIGPRGADRECEVTVTRGEPLPPTQEKGERYQLADPTRHKSK